MNTQQQRKVAVYLQGQSKISTPKMRLQEAVEKAWQIDDPQKREAELLNLSVGFSGDEALIPERLATALADVAGVLADILSQRREVA